MFLEAQKYYFVFESRLNFFSTLPKVVKIDVENDNVVSTLSNVVELNIEKHNFLSRLFNVVNFNIDVHNVVSTLIWRCATLQRHINLKQRWTDVEMFTGVDDLFGLKGIFRYKYPR